MNKQQWYNEDLPEQENFYSTGSTQPKKSRRGILAVLLMVIIFCGGIITALGLMNIRLFRQLSDPPEETAPFFFSEDETQTEASAEHTETTTPTTPASMELQLNQTPQSIENIPQEGGLSLQAIYEKAIPSVVSISCAGSGGNSTGTGVALSADGYIVTNCHVVENATDIEILLSSGESVSAALVGMDSASDLAVLYVKDVSLTPAEFGDSSSLRVGDAVVAIGDPLGVTLRGTMTDGIVSAINRDITTSGRTMTLIQTNAALNSGNSGGPLLNCYGQVIGINTMKIGDYMNSAGVEGLGFAIPSTTVKEIVDQLVSNGYVSGRPSLGIEVQEVSAFDQMYYRIPQGLYITRVEPDSSAARQGISPGDILLSFDDTRITGTDMMRSLLYSYNAGDTVNVVIYRAGTQYTVTLTLDEAQ